VFRDNGRGGLSYLIGHSVKYIPIGDKIEINLGVDPNVVFELIKLRSWRDNILMYIHAPGIFRQVGGGMQIEANSSVVGWDEHSVYTQRIRNYTAKTIDVEVRRTWGGHVKFRSDLTPEPKLFDYQTVEFRTTVEPAKKADLLFELVTSMGRNAKQNNITLEKAEVKP
ncbi:MAG: hypothetical protein K8T91_26275, partial [Planctomycetes bacterium]|nr:hypothetical protein [Planctomycetota bacterium]